MLVLALGTGPDDLIDLDQPGGMATLTTADVNLLWTIGRQAGQALERARLHEQTARQAERASFLLEAARLLAEAADVAETVDRLAGLVVGRLADLCVIDLDSDEGLVRPAVRHRDPERAHLAEELRAHHLPRRSATHPSVRALRERRHPVDALGRRRLPAVGRGGRGAPGGDAGAGPDRAWSPSRSPPRGASWGC